ncbi:winged helix-turn-helix transcriptional regulator [Aggregatilinea lenta]|uniref:winged helix-turn-helix transcriptional regulator n=1 Tax=Aggregatilinea lenta TaxID=913108 RepID=UPI000E5B5951|nr:winged helix-turn-helix transcriptional regulator [Aggregatilinea lenta]
MKKKQKKGTSSRDRIFEYIVRYKREHDGLAPAITEIAEGCYLSVSTVKYHLFMLEREDRIRLDGRRRIEVVGGKWDLGGNQAAPTK